LPKKFEPQSGEKSLLGGFKDDFNRDSSPPQGGSERQCAALQMNSDYFSLPILMVSLILFVGFTIVSSKMME
jgi:hypothetical protein